VYTTNERTELILLTESFLQGKQELASCVAIRLRVARNVDSQIIVAIIEIELPEDPALHLISCGRISFAEFFEQRVVDHAIAQSNTAHGCNEAFFLRVKPPVVARWMARVLV
jgi:hypothetical protein